MDKPTIKQIEEWQAGLNGVTHTDLPFAFYTTPLEEYNVVSKPKHYMLFDEADLFDKDSIEVRDVLEKLVSKIRSKPAMTGLFESDYVQLMQYLMRFMDKNGKEDLEKARWYLDKMIQAY